MLSGEMNGEKAAFPYDPKWGNPPGLTKRELLAAMAMAGFLADPGCPGNPEDIAAHAVACADALLRRLAQD